VDAVVDGVDDLDVDGAIVGDVLTDVNLTYPRRVHCDSHGRIRRILKTLKEYILISSSGWKKVHLGFLH